MTKMEFESILERLGITQAEVAPLLSVNARTVRRWAENPDEIPGPAVQALHAWLRLEKFHLPWRPDALAIGEGDPSEIADQIARYRRHSIDLDALLAKVTARGGPAAPWSVDLEKRKATLGPMTVSFYPLLNGSFSPGMYTRRDCDPDPVRDWSLIEDAFACVAKAISAVGKDWIERP